MQLKVGRVKDQTRLENNRLRPQKLVVGELGPLLVQTLTRHKLGNTNQCFVITASVCKEVATYLVNKSFDAFELFYFNLKLLIVAKEK